MNKIYKIALIVSILFGVISCDDESDFAIQEAEATFSILSPSSNTEIVLDRDTESNPGLIVAWEDMLGTAPYTVEFAVTGTEFASPQVAATSDVKSVTWTVAELNTFLTETLGLAFNEKQNVDLRILSADGNMTDAITLAITPYGLQDLPRLAVPGNHQGWQPDENEADYVPYVATTLDEGATNYEGYMWLDGEFKLVEPNGDGQFVWGNTDWEDDGSFAGLMSTSGPGNFPGVAAGYYRIQADTGSMTYSVVPVNWGIIGGATPTGWDSDTDLVYNPTTKVLEADVDLVAGPYKFRGNDTWGEFDLGTIDADGFLQAGGDLTFEGPDGNYHIVLDLSNPRRYTVTLTAN